MSLKRYIGCCGAYCKTCKPFIVGYCKGCKLGYDTGKRDINRAKCKIKLCCFKDKKFNTCADCSDFPCEILKSFYGKGRKRYEKSIVFIKEKGYSKFIKLANEWNDSCGKLG